MADIDLRSMPPVLRIALAYSPAGARSQLALALALDLRLAQIVARTSEPMLGQMRLAWWREALRQAPEARPRGDAVLDAVSGEWIAGSHALVALVDGWEQLLGTEALDEAAAHAFAEGRVAALLAAVGIEAPGSHYEAAQAAVLAWAFGDLASKVSNEDERTMLICAGLAIGAPATRLPHQARSLAVLGALGRRALRRGGRPLMEGRTAALVALRGAIFRR